MTYHDFLQSKTRRFGSMGFQCDGLPSALFDWQQQIVRWAVSKGRAAIWADTGLGKTAMQLAWADQVARHTGKPVLILTPLAVSYQTVKEAAKFGLHAEITDQTTKARIQVTNYHKLHRFDTSAYGGVVLDESSILKSFQGRIKTQLTQTFAETPFRLACTATPAPNDHLELGNHSDFLGIMPQKEMLARWFLNDLMGNMSWRLKGHARKDFWRWVASWALVLRKPSDLGYSDDGFILPPLNVQHVTVPTEGIRISGALFADASLSATTLHEVLRQTAPMRAKRACDIVLGSKENWLLWTHTNYEADAIHETELAIDEVRGADSDEKKEKALLGFADGSVKRLMTKPSIAGFGMNWQKCHNMLFVGMNYSYEQFYQAVRCCWRFGQSKSVNVYCLATEMEWRLFDALAKKQKAHEEMQTEMIGLMKDEYAELTCPR